MWLELKVSLPDEARERIFPVASGGTHASDARNITAKLNEAAGNPLPPAFFHYDEVGRPRHGRPPVCFGTFTKGISVVGVGAEGVDLVDAYGHKLRRMWSEKVGAPLLESRFSGTNALRWSAYPRKYLIHGLAIEPPQPWSFDRTNFRDQLDPIMAKAILAGIQAQVDSNHADDSSIQGSEVLNELDQLRVGITGCERLTFRSLEHSKSGRAAIVVCRRVEFEIPIELQGVWHVGRLPSRGFGQIREVNARGLQERT